LAYEDLLDFEGSEFYEAPLMAEAAGLSFGELLNAFPTCCPVGIVDSGGQVQLVPPMERRLSKSDTLVLLAEDDSKIYFAGPCDVEAARAAETDALPVRAPERVLVVGWNHVGARLLAEIDQSLPPGSAVTLVIDRDTCRLPPEGVAITAQLTVELVHAEDYPSMLAATIGQGCDHVVILAERNLPAEEADARALLATLQVRHALDRLPSNELGRSLVTELLDEANVDLARQVSAGEFIVSERLTSLLMAQLAQTPDLQRVFDQLLDPAGPELNARPIGWYAMPGVLTSFGAVVESARGRGEIALGYRLVRHAKDVQRSFGVLMNPPKSFATQFEASDRLIVLAPEEN
jgi:hypothetical protein